MLFLLSLHLLLGTLQGVSAAYLLNQLEPFLLTFIHHVLDRPTANHLLQEDGSQLGFFHILCAKSDGQLFAITVKTTRRRFHYHML